MDEKNALESTSAANDSTARTQRKTKALEFLMFVFFVAKTLSGNIRKCHTTLKDLGVIKHGSALIKLAYLFICIHSAL